MENLVKQFNKSNFFSTQVTSPASSTGQRKSFFKSKEQLLSKARDKFKSKKRQIKSVQKQYSQVLQRSHRSSVEYDQVKKKSQIIRFKFVKMYQNKRYNLINQQLKIKLVNSNEQTQKLSTERVRQIKFQRQSHMRYLKNQQIDIRSVLKQKNKQKKNKINQLLQKSQQKLNQYVYKNSQRVKNENHQFMIRKTNYLCMKGSKAKFNYMNKLKQQIQAIRGYENLLEQIPTLDIEPQQKDFVTQVL